MIPVANPKAQYLSYKDEIDQTILRVLERGWYIFGEEVQSFEREFADYIGVKFAIGVGSGTEALHLAIKCCGIGAGDEVITVSHTAVATVAAIGQAGAFPVFVDIDPITFTMDPSCLKSAITSSTKAIIPVHLYGHPAQMDEIKEIAVKHDLFLIEDCAQAHGAIYKNRRVGSFGDISCFSFYPTKNLGALGDGGIVVTNNEALAEKAVLLRQYGWSERYISKIPGWNTRLDEVQAAVLRVKLRNLDRDNAARVHLAALYNQKFKDTSILTPIAMDGCKHVYHLYVIHTNKRDGLINFLYSKGIGSAIHYPIPVHRQPAYAGFMNELPETERITRTILSLPMYPELTTEEVNLVADAVISFTERQS